MSILDLLNDKLIRKTQYVGLNGKRESAYTQSNIY